MSDHSFALSVEMPDDEPRQIVCTGEEAGVDIWQPAFGVWEADDFGIDADETVGDGERLYVSRRIYDAMAARLADAEAMAEALNSADIMLTLIGCMIDTETPMLNSKVVFERRNAIRAALAKWRAGK